MRSDVQTVVVELQRRPPIGSPIAQARTSRRTSSSASRSGSAVQAIEAPSVAHVARIRPPARRAPGGSLAGRPLSGRQRRQAQPAGTRPSEIQAIYDSLWANAGEKICTWGPARNPKTAQRSRRSRQAQTSDIASVSPSQRPSLHVVFARSARPHIRHEAAARARRQVSPLRTCAPRPPRRGRLCKNAILHAVTLACNRRQER